MYSVTTVRRVLSTLKKSFINIGKKRVSKIMHKLQLNGIGKPKFKITTKLDAKASRCPDLISGNFTSYKPNQIWTSDITYIPTKEGWIYLCIILDTFSRAIVGWCMQNTLKREIIINSLNMAYPKRDGFPVGIIFLNRFHQSMSNSCYDNSISETFFSTLKKELVHRCNFQTRKEGMAAVTEYIEVFYNRIRAHSALDYQAPLEYEKNYEI